MQTSTEKSAKRSTDEERLDGALREFRKYIVEQFTREMINPDFPFLREDVHVISLLSSFFHSFFPRQEEEIAVSFYSYFLPHNILNELFFTQVCSWLQEGKHFPIEPLFQKSIRTFQKKDNEKGRKIYNDIMFKNPDALKGWPQEEVRRRKLLFVLAH